MNALDAVYAAFPWLRNLGIGTQITDWIKEGYNDDSLVGLVRQTSQWNEMFQGIKRTDGTLRMTEGSYLQTKDAYTTLIFNYTGKRVTSSSQIAGLLENDVSPDEMEKRLQIYDSVKRDGGDIRSAFYVYAGMRLSDDDLYSYMVDPTKRSEFDASYTQQSAATNLTYAEFIKRTTEVGLQNVTDLLTDLQGQGVATDEAIRRVQSINPDAAAQLSDLLYHGGDPANGSFLGLNELMRSFELAMIGSAATAQGFTLPDASRVEAFRNAGIDRTKALTAYGTYAANEGKITGMTERIGSAFGQSEWENAQFLRSGTEQALLAQAQGQETALGKANNTGDFSFDSAGRLRQRGLALT